MANKKKQPTKKKKTKPKKRKKILDGYYLPGDGTIRTLYKDENGGSI